MFIVRISLPYCHISLPYITKFVIVANHPRSQLTPSHCVIWSATFVVVVVVPLVECWCMRPSHCSGRPSGVDHASMSDGRTISDCLHISYVLFHNVTCYTNSKVSRIYVNTTELRNVTCTLVAHA